MKIKSFVSGSVKVIVPEGEISKTDPGDLRALQDEFRFIRLFSEVLFDLSGVQFAGSMLINLLVCLRNRHPGDYQKIKIINPNRMIQELFRMTRINESYAVFCDEEAASAVL